MTKTVAHHRRLPGIPALSLGFLILAQLAFGAPPVVIDEDNQIFELGSFRFESGVKLPNTRLSYVTHGALNAERTNAVLVPSER